MPASARIATAIIRFTRLLLFAVLSSPVCCFANGSGVRESGIWMLGFETRWKLSEISGARDVRALGVIENGDGSTRVCIELAESSGKTRTISVADVTTGFA